MNFLVDFLKLIYVRYRTFVLTNRNLCAIINKNICSYYYNHKKGGMLSFESVSMNMAEWNPWHGCKKISAGCQNCYMHSSDAKYGRDGNKVMRTAGFHLPIKKKRNGSFRLSPADKMVWTCFTSDFLIDEADEWRYECWRMIRMRPDLNFFFITKRIDRFMKCLPDDWNMEKGWDNVTVGCTCENQDRADYRLPIFLELPIRHKVIICEPLLEEINLEKYLDNRIEKVVAGGESGCYARICRFDWINSLRNQCINANVPFWFKQTGALFEKNNRVYHIERRNQHSQASKSGLSFEHK